MNFLVQVHAADADAEMLPSGLMDADAFAFAVMASSQASPPKVYELRLFADVDMETATTLTSAAVSCCLGINYPNPNWTVATEAEAEASTRWPLGPQTEHQAYAHA